jgi:flagellar basal-body rod protein FlgF
MNYGLYLSASGVLTSMHRQDVVANNLANVNTVGFKPDDVALMSRLPERLEGGAFGMLNNDPADPQWLLERLGGGQFIAPSRVDLRQGVLQRTGNDLDLAIEGEGFFVVNSGPNGGANGGGALRLTRDGRFTLNHAGELVMAATGHRVLDANDQPIVLARDEPVRIDSAGQISQHGEIVATVQIASVSDKSALAKEGDNLLRFADPASGTLVTRRSASGAVKQHHIENSAVDPVMALNDLIAASRAVQANATMMQHHNTILGEAINTFGRVA